MKTIPDELRGFGAQLHQDFIDEHGSLADGIDWLLSTMTIAERETVKGTINHLLQLKKSEAYSLWEATESFIVPRKVDIHAFLSEILKIFARYEGNLPGK